MRKTLSAALLATVVGLSALMMPPAEAHSRYHGRAWQSRHGGWDGWGQARSFRPCRSDGWDRRAAYRRHYSAYNDYGYRRPGRYARYGNGWGPGIHAGVGNSVFANVSPGGILARAGGNRVSISPRGIRANAGGYGGYDDDGYGGGGGIVQDVLGGLLGP